MTDLDALEQAIYESLDHLVPWMPWAADPGRQQTSDFLARNQEEWEARRAFGFAITSDAAVIGSCGLMRRIGAGGLEIGYWLHPQWTASSNRTFDVATPTSVLLAPAASAGVENSSALLSFAPRRMPWQSWAEKVVFGCRLSEGGTGLRLCSLPGSVADCREKASHADRVAARSRDQQSVETAGQTGKGGPALGT
ncbi:GNAT family N-acetyltransferase [Streptomyces sasae]|uniref:GNAT family N-acetyltransferase n=1 Tax=Streptomyces sasae TaxID=1266772 RepID=UPI00292FD253|nr:GNAT family N-acetyltransferase [Streptomyces sasae]